MSEPVTNEFDSDTHRRVAANLSQPRSVQDLLEQILALDPHVQARTEGEIGDVLRDLEADGLVKRLKETTDADELIKEISGDDKLPSLPKAKADAIRERAPHPGRTPYLSREQWYMTQAALDRLTGPIPNEPPPKQGDDLAAAEAHNEQLAAETREAEKGR